MPCLVISTPHPSRPEDVKDARAEFRSWVGDLKAQSKVACFYPRVGRRSVVILDVSSNDELHEIITESFNIVPTSFVVHPLATPGQVEQLLD